jgi:uncharacterized lipoprotein YajG
MNKILMSILTGLSAIVLFSGCAVGFNFGGGKKDMASTTSNNTTSNTSTTNSDQHPAASLQSVEPTIGQQLMDLKKARDTDAITEAEYEAEKAKLLGNK